MSAIISNMNIIQRYIAYLKDNPNGYWFKRKLYGWGWTPATWEGWTVTVVAIGAILFVVLRAERLETQEAVLFQVALPVIVIALALILISYLKGEKPRWQWGEPIKKDESGESEQATDSKEY